MNTEHHRHINDRYIIPVCDYLLCVLCEDDFVRVYFCVNCLFAAYVDGLRSFLQSNQNDSNDY